MPITKKKTSSGFNNIINCKDKYCSKSKNGKKCMKKNCAKEVTTLDKNVKNHIQKKEKQFQKKKKILKKCSKKKCSIHIDKDKMKKCMKKKCSKEIKKLTSIIMM